MADDRPLSVQVQELQDQRDDAMQVVRAVVAGVRGEHAYRSATVTLDNDVMRVARRIVEEHGR
ncbi:hypothetical protein TEK04_19465 [Klenkia sp. LSe6-5]|uniref:Uncharacterized protein n=1 Tax=Klenkia sesuvii TaxID=3103137 RepID=A0ABU8DYJ7_9ACTN